MNNEPNNTHIPYIGMDASMSLDNTPWSHGMAWVWDVSAWLSQWGLISAW